MIEKILKDTIIKYIADTRHYTQVIRIIPVKTKNSSRVRKILLVKHSLAVPCSHFLNAKIQQIKLNQSYKILLNWARKSLMKSYVEVFFMFSGK